MHARMWLVTLMLLAVTSLVGAQRRSTPVKVEFEPPPTAMQQGETTTTRLVFRALTDVDRLQVSITPLRGVQIVSERRQVVFSNLRKGDGPELEVTVRLTDGKFGSLAVTYETDADSGSSADAFTIVYGSPER